MELNRSWMKFDGFVKHVQSPIWKVRKLLSSRGLILATLYDEKTSVSIFPRNCYELFVFVNRSDIFRSVYAYNQSLIAFQIDRFPMQMSISKMIQRTLTWSAQHQCIQTVSEHSLWTPTWKKTSTFTAIKFSKSTNNFSILVSIYFV